MSSLPNRGAAPELESLAWLNSAIPIRLADLRGQVVLLEFWTFDCINCIRTLPYVEGWYQTYRDSGLAVVSVHFPEFGYEHDIQNVLAATQRLNVTYPVGLDNDGATWDAYSQRYWPTMYVLDKQGNIRYTRIGENAYDQTEAAIVDLLAETYTPAEATNPILASLTPNENLNVRVGAGIDQPLLGVISPGSAFVILGEQAGWYHIRYNDGVGYVSGEYVTVTQ